MTGDPRSEDPAPGLIGRDDLLGELRGFVERSRHEGAARVLVGEAGVGKTALLDAACAFAEETGTRVLRVAGAEFEAEIGFAGLHALLAPLRNALDEVGPDLRDAVLLALGLRNGPVPRPLVTYSAVLELVTRASEDRPVLLCVDDLQWLDRASVAAIGFVARRVRGTRTGVLAAERAARATVLDGGGIPVVPVHRLPREHARELLARRHPALPPRLRRRVLSEADGNPLALLELVRSVPDFADPLAHLPTVMPLTSKLERAFAVRTTGLPVRTREALLLVAVAGRPDVRKLVRGGLPVDALAPAESAGLVTVDRESMTVAFGHPLIRSAIVRSAAPADVRRAHAAIATGLDDDPVRQTWHLAEAAVTPDEGVAGRLELAARGALAGGDAPVSTALLARAARLSPLGSAAARRLAQAASLAAQVTGDLGAAARFLDEARRLDPSITASLHGASAAAYTMVNGDGDIDSAHRLLAAAVERELRIRAAPDHELGEAMTTLLFLCWWAGREEYWTSFERALARLGPDALPLLGIQSPAFTDTVRRGAELRARLRELISSHVDEHEPAQIIRLLTSAVYVDMVAGCREVAWRLVESGRGDGAIRSGLGALMLLCLDDFASGRWEEAEHLAEEGIERCQAHGYRFLVWYFLYNKALLAAVRGNVPAVRELTTELDRVARARRAATPGHHAAHARTLAAIAAGDWESAFRHASALSSPGAFAPHRPVAMWVAFDLVESALKTGRGEAARAHVAAIVANDVAAVSPRMAVNAWAARALVAEGERAARLFERALAVEGADDFPFDLARVQLAYGERLRRDLRFVRARQVLNSALEKFEALDAVPWAERTRRELRAARDPGLPRPVLLADNALTAQERAIAELAAAGLSNKEIARRLYLSPRTVGGHLYRVFPKLGISTRAALRDALDRLPGPEPVPVP